MSRCRWKACKHRTRLSGNNQAGLPSWDETFKRGQGKSLAGLLLCLVGRAGLSVSWPGSGLIWLKFPTVAEACPERGHQEKTESGLKSKHQKMYKNFYYNTQQKLPVGVCLFTLLSSTSAYIFSLFFFFFFFLLAYFLALLNIWTRSITLVKILKDDAISAALNMPANLENSALATGLEKVSFHSSPKEGQCQTMFKLQYNCAYFTC